MRVEPTASIIERQPRREAIPASGNVGHVLNVGSTLGEDLSQQPYVK